MTSKQCEQGGGVGVDDDRVVYETIDGETILIDLSTGTYFSLRESGPEIWELLLATGSINGAISALAHQFPEYEALREEVIRFAKELISHGLLITDPDHTGRTSKPPATNHEPGAVFTPPVIESYSDMEYFLLLDPIHEVDGAAGWPTPAPVSQGHKAV